MFNSQAYNGVGKSIFYFPMKRMAQIVMLQMFLVFIMGGIVSSVFINPAMAQEENADNGNGQVSPHGDAQNNESELPTEWYRSDFILKIFQAVDSTRIAVGEAAFDILSAEIAGLIGVFLGIWLLYQGAMLLLPFGQTMNQGGSEILNTILIRCLMTILVMAMVMNYEFFWRVHTIFVDGGMNLATTILLQVTNVAGAINGVDTSCVAPPSAPGADDADYGAQLYCVVTLMQSVLGVGIQVGIALTEEFFKAPTVEIFTKGAKFMYAIAGYNLIFAFAATMLMIPFRVFDLLVKWTVVTVTAPVLIAMALFPITRRISFASLKILLSSMITLVLMTIVVAIAFAMMLYVLDQNNIDLENITDETFEDVGFASPVFWHLLAVAVIVFSLLGQVGGVAQSAVNMASGLRIPEVGAQLGGVALRGLDATLRVGMAGRFMNAGMDKLNRTNMGLKHRLRKGY